MRRRVKDPAEREEMLRDCEAIAHSLASQYGIPLRRIYSAHKGDLIAKKIRRMACYYAYCDGIVSPIIARCFGISEDTVRYCVAKYSIEGGIDSPVSVKQFKNRSWAKNE